ncbi:gp39 [Burkholderia pseudomallei]|nr:gp39 [Burkholderia pseudomallei]
MTTTHSRADALTAHEALAAIETFEIVGENNDSREPNAEDRFILTEFVAHAFGGFRVEQPAAAPIPEDCDVRSILLDVVPGADGEGREVYARNVDDVKRLLSEMGDRLEDVDAAKRLAPSPADERAAFEAALDKRAKSAGFEVGRMTECELDNAWWGWQAGRVAYANETGAEGALIERLKLLLSGDAAFCKTIVARSAIEQAIAILSRPSAQEDARVGLTAEARATIMDACQSISRSADALRQCHTVDGDWGDDVDAKAFYDAELRLLERLTALIARPGQPEPIDMLLFCPKCGVQHVDAPEKASEGHSVLYTDAWTNSPHRSHLCHACGTIWRPADVPTNGVAAIQTRGKADTWDGEPEPETATVARIEQLRKALFESRDAMRVMSNWVKKSDPAGHSWAVRMVDRANAALNGEPEPRSEVTDDDKLCAELYRWLRERAWYVDAATYALGLRERWRNGDEPPPDADDVEQALAAARAGVSQ